MITDEKLLAKNTRTICGVAQHNDLISQSSKFGILQVAQRPRNKNNDPSIILQEINSLFD